MKKWGLPHDVVRWTFGCSMPRFEATSPHLSVINPLFLENGVINPETNEKVIGIPMGECGMGRLRVGFAFDEFEFFRHDIIQSLNVAVFGKLGKRKSAFVKTFLHRAFCVGYNSLIIDPKDEYDLLVQFLQETYGEMAKCKILRFGPGSTISLNPLDPLIDEDGKKELLASLLIPVMGNGHEELNIEERSLLKEAIKEVAPDGRVATLPQLRDALYRPTTTMSRNLHENKLKLKATGREMALGLNHLSDIFHEVTNPDLFEPHRVLLMVCKGLSKERAALTVSVLNNLVFGHALQNTKSNQDHRYHRVVLDETWDLAEYKPMVVSMRRLSKIGNSTEGVSLWVVMHHPKNAERSGGHEAIKDLLPDSGTTFGFQMDKNELLASADALRYGPSDIARNLKLNPGESLCKMGDRPTLKVKQIAWPEELEMLETRHLVRGKTRRRVEVNN